MTPSPDTGRRLAAVWFADIVGYTSLSAQDEDAAMRMVGVFQRLAGEIVPQFSGRIVKFVGDAALAEFASTDGAIRSALMLLERFSQDEAARHHGTTIRVGVNVGEVISSPDGDIYGDGVNLASRLQSSAAPGQVVASEAVQTQIRQRPVFRTEALGEKELKGITNPIRLYSVTLLEPGAEPAAWRGWCRYCSPWWAGWSRSPSWIRVPRASPARATPSWRGGLDVGAAITVHCSADVDPATATSQNVQLLDGAGAPVPASVALGPDGSSVVIDPRGPLSFGADYTVEVSDALRGIGGDPVRGIDGEGTGARLAIRTQPAPRDAVRARIEHAAGFAAEDVSPDGPVPVRFTEPIEPSSAAGAVRLTTAAGEAVEATLLFTDANREVRVKPSAPLTAGARYVIRVDSTMTSATDLPVIADSVVIRVAERAVPAPAPTQPSGRAPAQTAATTAGATPSRTGAGTLNLTVSPAAAQPFVRVVIDGDTVGAPPVRGVSLAEGCTHTITLVGIPELSQHRLAVYQQTFTVDPGQVLNVTADVTPFGSIDVVSEPAGTVCVDGRQVGRTPLAGYPVTARVVHRLEIRPTGDDAERVGAYASEFRVEPFEWRSLGRVTLPPRNEP